MKIIAVMPYSGETEFLARHPDVIDGRIPQASLQDTMYRLGQLVAESDRTGQALLVYASETVLNVLEDHGLSYYLVYPSADCKDEYVKRSEEVSDDKRNVVSKLYAIAWDDLLDDMHRRRKAYPMILGKCMLMNDMLTVNAEHEIILKD